MADCVPPRKNHLGRATFCSFCLKTRRVILTDDLCVRKTWKIKRQKELQQDISIFFGSMIVSSAGLRTTSNTADRLLRWHGLRLSAASDAFAWGCFPHRKKFRHQAFWLFWFCVCGYSLLSPSHGHLASTRIQIWLTRYCTCVVYMVRAKDWKLQLMFSSPSFDYQTWRKGSLPGGWKHTGTLAIVVSPRASKWVRSFWIICVSLRSTITGCRKTQVFGVF